jgi:hypothetical protein
MKSAQENTGRIHRREKTSWKAQRKMFRWGGQGCKDGVEMHKLAKIGRE